MAQFVSDTKRRSSLGEAVSGIAKEDKDMRWQKYSVYGIIRAIEWPSFQVAVKYTVGTMAASVVIGICLYLYGFGINQLIAMFR